MARELLTPKEMSRVDGLAIAGGLSGLALMENAGRATADAATELAAHGARIAVLCGPGNNGGDGFVAARLLAERGYAVWLALLGERNALQGDAAAMAHRWTGEVLPLDTAPIPWADLVVDAIFGAGLSRAVEGAAAEVIATLTASGKPVVAVDVPSGLDGATGEIRGTAPRALVTVTFFRRKPGHLLLPGRLACGEVKVADIGIPPAVLDGVRPNTWANGPDLWLGHYPWPKLDGHKYDRGHTVVVSGPADSTGAARLAARAALRIGSGLATVASPRDAVAVNAAQLTAVMLRPCDGAGALREMLADRRKNAVLVGPGAGLGDVTAETIWAALASGAHTVLDADALTMLAGQADALARQVAGASRAVVLTPHTGEFARVFPHRAGLDKLSRTRAAARDSGAVVVLKGPDTVIAAPDGRAAINDNAPPWLATAGSGDVLAGFVTGLLAQGMAAFEAACAAVWLHGDCAATFGPGLIAEDLSEMVPQALRRLASQGICRTG
ncbi:MAG: NAD(P)H-hydrate dehydratase [Hyphomicrobiaceae bacterium]